MSPTALLEKSIAGIDFVAHGNEPDWTLDIDLDHQMTFRSGRGSYQVPASPEARHENDEVSRYFSSTNQTDFIVTLATADCTDKWSNKFDHEVKVEVKYPGEDNFTLYQGCGKYLPDYRLHNIWVLTMLNGENVPPENAPRGLPEIEINANEKRVIGHGGCNSFTGTVKVQGNQIAFGPMASTKMACPDMNTENAFFAVLAGKTLTYALGENALHLIQDGKEVMVLKNVD